jgi:23S rRNA (cytidine2498-2'-O)-methyltransferase
VNKNDYTKAVGFIVYYKTLDEPMLFNEMKSRLQGIKLEKRGKSSAAFGFNHYEEVVTEIEKEEFIFLSHIHPYMSTRKINGDLSDLKIYVEMLAEIVPLLQRSETLVCQCKIDAYDPLQYANKDLTTLLAEELTSHGFQIVPQNAKIVISLTIYDDQAYMGVSYSKDNVSDWTGGVLFYSKADDIICRAEFKIEEACKTFHMKLAEGMKVLDLGAAPGGWTHFLARQGLFVDAVDPANMDENVLRMHNVKHHKKTAQEFVKNRKTATYDILVNDMKMDTNQSVDIICEMSNQLKEGGVCLMTLKLPKTAVIKRIGIARKVLQKHFQTVRVKKLYYNRSEVTVYAVK